MTRRQWWTVSLLLIAHKLWLPTLLSERLFSPNFYIEQMFNIFQLSAAAYMLVMLALTGWVLERCLPAKRYGLLVLGLLGLVPFFIAFRYGLEEMLYPLLFGRGNYHPDTSLAHYTTDNVQYAIVYLIMGSLLYFLDAHTSDRRRLAALSAAGREAELQFLKAQINPHFLFNSLNNVYALVHEQSPKASEALLQLTALSRMQLRTQAHEATAEEELDGLEPYLQLQAMRYPFALNIVVQRAGNLQAVSLPVFSLLCFVENVFKHGDLTAAVVISVQECDGHLHVSVRNQVGKAVSKDSTGGVGLENIRTRLHLLYGPRAALKRSQTDQVFSVHLTIAPLQGSSARPSDLPPFLQRLIPRPRAAFQNTLQP